MVDRNSWGCCNDLQIENKNVISNSSIQKAKVLVEEVECKLELLCKESRVNIISKLWTNKYWTAENLFNCLDLLVDDLSVFTKIINA